VCDLLHSQRVLRYVHAPSPQAQRRHKCTRRFPLYRNTDSSSGTLYAYTPEVLPSAHRATGNGIAIACNRVMGLVSAAVATSANTATSAPIYICAVLYIVMVSQHSIVSEPQADSIRLSSLLSCHSSHTASRLCKEMKQISVRSRQVRTYPEAPLRSKASLVEGWSMMVRKRVNLCCRALVP